LPVPAKYSPWSCSNQEKKIGRKNRILSFRMIERKNKEYVVYLCLQNWMTPQKRSKSKDRLAQIPNKHKPNPVKASQRFRSLSSEYDMHVCSVSEPLNLGFEPLKIWSYPSFPILIYRTQTFRKNPNTENICVYLFRIRILIWQENVCVCVCTNLLSGQSGIRSVNWNS